MKDATTPAVEDALPRNFLRACLLLLLSEEPSHGYDLLARLEDFGLGEADQAGLYRALRGMERDGLLTSHWQMSEAGPSRRTYELSHTGQLALRTWSDALEQCRSIIDHYIAAHQRLSIREAPDGRRGVTQA